MTDMDAVADFLKEQGRDDLAAIGRWISVKDRLPDPCDAVLALFRDGPHVALLSVSYRASAPTWYIPDLKEWGSDATHWMPLPPHPEPSP